MTVLVKYPSRGRPQLFWETLAKWKVDLLPNFLVSIDADDPTMNDTHARLMADRRTTLRIGHSKSKIEAVNDGVKDAKWDGLLILAADDMVPQRDDYAQRIVELFTEHFPNGDGVLHLNDGRTGKSLNTLPICDHRYLDRFGYIYNPVYTSLFADNEFQEVSERLCRAKYVDEVIIRHEWVGDHLRDDLHVRNESYYDADEKTFKARQQAGFP